jgi:DNA-directed RNA polymerase specialized sigma24 family protein
VGRAANHGEPGFPDGQPQPLGREKNPADIAEQSDLHAHLRTLITELPDNQREVLDLWTDGFSYLHISEITNHTAGHIRVLLHRALKTLREHPRIRTLTEDEPISSDSDPAAQRRQHVAVGVSPRKAISKEHESPEGATP